MPPLITDAARPALIEGPTDPILAKLWTLAVSKFEVQQGHGPESRADWRVITKDYRHLMGKAEGSIAHVIARRCAEVPGGD